MAVDERNGRSYRLEPLDASGLFLGLGAVQCGLIGGGVTMAVVLVTARAPVIAAVVPVIAGVAGSFARLGGHAAWEWLPLGATWVWAGATRGRRWAAPLPLWPVDRDKPAALPPCLAGLEVIPVRWRGELSIGAVHDRQRRTLTAILPVQGEDFVLLPADEQDRHVGGWSDVLGQLSAGSNAVAHLSWSSFVCASGAESHERWLASRDAVGSAYDEVLELVAAHAVSHEVVVSLTVALDRLSGRRPTGRSGDPLAVALVSAVESLVRGCRSAGLQPADPLEPQGVHRLLQGRADPITESRSGRLAARLGLSPAVAGPLAVETEWGHVKVDGSYHCTYWVESWPRQQVPSSWMEPFLAAGGTTRSTTVVFVPVSTYQSRRRIQRDLVKLESDAVTKEDKGRRIDARHQRATQTLLDREQELVAGFVEMAYVGLITVSAGSEDDLLADTEVISQLAREVGMDLRCLVGRQDLAWAAALPLGLAPKTLIAT